MEIDDITILRILQEHPELVLQACAKRRLEWFASYMNTKFVASPFHKSYYRVLDYFATGRIKKLIIQAPPQHGKALKIDTPVLTTKGWKRHIDLKVGDFVFGEDGKPKKVVWNSGRYKHPTQQVNFADGFSLIAAPEHEWVVYIDKDNHKPRERQILETREIFKRHNRRNPAIKADAVIDMPDAELPIAPYLLGVWLGDGNSIDKWVCCGAQDLEHLRPFIIEQKRTSTAYMVHLYGLETRDLRKLGVLQNKHIPIEYLLSSREQRMALLRGLMDTDGYINERGTCEFSQKTGRLADDVYVLLRSLGYKAVRHDYVARLYGKDCGMKARITFNPDKTDRIFDIPRKQERLTNKKSQDRDDKRRFFITSIDNLEERYVNCIQVDGGIYLAGYELVPTHNSEGSSRNLPALMLGLNPDLKIVIASYAATIAKDFNRDIQRIIDSPEYNAIFPDTTLNNSNVVSISEGFLRNSDVFEIVGHKGSLRVVGRGGALTSKTADVIIYDDLYKDASEANSPLIRDGAWDWYTKVARSRLHNNSQELIVFTRWHPEDIIGKIIESEPVIFAKQWRDFENVPEGAWVLVNFEAIKASPPNEIDSRNVGEALWPERHSLERLETQRALDPVGFDCLYQGSPETAEGRLYQPFKEYSDKSEWGTYIRSGCCIDVADEGDDYLCALTYDIYKSTEQTFNEHTKRFEPLLFALITDVEFTDAPTDITTVTVPRMINANKVQKVWVESNNGGSQFNKTITRKVKAICIPYYEGTNKESRIITNAPFVNQQIVMPFGWENRYPKFHKHVTEFLRVFTANKHDDGVDCLTDVFLKELADGNCKPYGASHRGVKVH